MRYHRCAGTDPHPQSTHQTAKGHGPRISSGMPFPTTRCWAPAADFTDGRGDTPPMRRPPSITPAQACIRQRFALSGDRLRSSITPRQIRPAPIRRLPFKLGHELAQLARYAPAQHWRIAIYNTTTVMLCMAR